jgi:hypothetical protein
MILSHGKFFIFLLCAAYNLLSFLSPKGQVISHVMCHVQIM